ncbi:MAG: C69 family dipeptidase [Bacteroidales bacterium]|nr:C69 family dipeptidase [Bacteroidales bacterium]
MTNKILATLITFGVFSMNNVLPCTNFLITKGASADGSTMITYAADSHVLYGELYFLPARDYPEGTMLDVYEWDTGKFLGKIPQVKHTYSVVGNMNEHQVAIGETTYGGRHELVDSTGIMDYGSLMFIALQRAKTAREAIILMGDLMSAYGYCSSGESLSISDPHEVWIMEMIGKGVGNKGAVWVALRIPDGYVCGHANQARITTFPLNDPENCLYAKDVISFAREKGYFSGNDEEFSFSDAYAPLDFGAARFCESRVWTGFRKVAKEMEQYEDYAMGMNLKNRMPLWVKAERKVTVQDVMGMMRDYFQDTKMDMTKDIGAGPFQCIVRWRPMTWQVDGVSYLNERAISTQQTGFSFVAQSRSWLPDPIGGILWFGVDDTYSTVYTPMYCGITSVPENYAVGNGSMMEFSENSAFWIFNQVSNFAYTKYSYMIPEIQDRQKELENTYVNDVIKTDKIALDLYNKKKTKKVRLMLTEFSCQAGAHTFNTWKALYAHLFTKYMDGNVKTTVEGQRNPGVSQPGYNEEWYRMVVRETGDKFRIIGESAH